MRKNTVKTCFILLFLLILPFVSTAESIEDLHFSLLDPLVIVPRIAENNTLRYVKMPIFEHPNTNSKVVYLITVQDYLPVTGWKLFPDKNGRIWVKVEIYYDVNNKKHIEPSIYGWILAEYIEFETGC